jgi:hypothetical protein
MLRVRLFPLEHQLVPSTRVFVGSDVSENAVDTRTVDEVAANRVVDLFMFSRIACGLNCAMLAVAIFMLAFYENGTFAEKYRFRNPLTHTAMVWTSQTDEAVNSNPLLEKATCEAYDSRTFYKPGAFVREATFLYSTVHSRWLILFAIGIGCLFQLATVMEKTKYYAPFTVGNTHITGYLERSISMPLFVVVLLLQTGMHDMWTILSLMFNAWGAMLFSFFAEVLFQGDGDLKSIGAKPTPSNEKADTVRNGGGFMLWKDGDMHYHALAMLLAIANYVLVSGGLLYNTLLINSCIASHHAPPVTITFPIYMTVVLYGLLLAAQAFVAYVKDTPRTVENDKAALIKQWGEFYDANSPSEDQTKLLNSGLDRRIDYALHLEFFYGLLDLLLKSIMTMSLFLFERG